MVNRHQLDILTDGGFADGHPSAFAVSGRSDEAWIGCGYARSRQRWPQGGVQINAIVQCWPSHFVPRHIVGVTVRLQLPPHRQPPVSHWSASHTVLSLTMTPGFCFHFHSGRVGGGSPLDPPPRKLKNLGFGSVFQ